MSMMLSERLRALLERTAALHQAVSAEVRAIEAELRDAEKAWPDHQVVRIRAWRSREEIPPPGRIWATDGTAVWLIWSDGAPISASASSVKYWTDALIPAPPASTEIDAVAIKETPNA